MDKQKVVIIGDGTVGKTCLLETFTTGIFPEGYVPTVFDTKTKTVTDGNMTNNLQLWDTAGQEDFARLRKLTYTDAKCFILCYAIHKSHSLDNIKSKWLPELIEVLGRLKVPLILVGNQSDLRESNDSNATTTAQGNKMRRLIRAFAFVECSAKENTNVDEVFLQAARAINHFQKHGCQKKFLCCSLL